MTALFGETAKSKCPEIKLKLQGEPDERRDGPFQSREDTVEHLAHHIFFTEAVALQLAIRLAPSYGKQVSPDTKANASQSFKTMVAKLSPPKSRQMPQGIPLGGGNRWRGRIFTPAPEETSDLVDGDNTIESI